MTAEIGDAYLTRESERGEGMDWTVSGGFAYCGEDWDRRPTALRTIPVDLYVRKSSAEERVPKERACPNASERESESGLERSHWRLAGVRTL